MVSNTTIVGRNIRTVAAHRQISLRNLARKAGVSEINLSFIVNGRTKNPGIVTIEKVARALGTDVNTLLKKDILGV